MPFKSNPENNPHFRICKNSKNNPNCENTIYYSSKYAVKLQDEKDTECKSCTRYLVPRPPSVGIAVSKARKGKPLSEEHKRKVRENANPYIRTDEHRRMASENNAGDKNYFFGKGDRQKGEKNHMYGKSIYKKWIEKYGIEKADEMIKEMYDLRSYKLSCNKSIEYSQWKSDNENFKDNFKLYRKRVNYYTNKNDLTKLPNFEKRGPSGQFDTYQLDHIVSIKYGFEHDIDPKHIGSIDNLWFVPWEINNKKREHSISILPFLNLEYYYPISQYGFTIYWRMLQIMEWNWGFKEPLPKLQRIN